MSVRSHGILLGAIVGVMIFLGELSIFFAGRLLPFEDFITRFFFMLGTGISAIFIARHKGRRVWIWVPISFFFTFIGLGVLILTRSVIERDGYFRS